MDNAALLIVVTMLMQVLALIAMLFTHKILKLKVRELERHSMILNATQEILDEQEKLLCQQEDETNNDENERR